MGRFFALGFILLPLLEIAMFILVGQAIGVLPTLALVILGVLVGSLVLRQQGLGIINRMRSNVSAGTLPGQAIFDAMSVGFAGILLILPGFISDIVALGLLVPALRHWLYKSLSSRITVVETTTTWRRQGDGSDPRIARPETIDLDDENWRRDP